MGINMQRNKQTWNITDLTNYSNIKDAQTFGLALEQIDNKLHDIKKEITYWDVYNISTAVYNKEEFENKVSNLNINSSLVINTTSFNASFNGKNTDFHSGDIVIRLKDGSYTHIKAANAGVYVPTITDENGEEIDPDDTTTNLKITYNYVTTVTDEQKEVSAPIKTLEGTNSSMYGYSIPGTYNSSTNQFLFNIVYQKAYDENGNLIYDENENVVYDVTKPIVPVLKFFDKNNQEVYTDEYTLLSNGSEYYFYLHNNSSRLIQKVVIK